MTTSVDDRAHPASKRGGWGVRIFDNPTHPTASYLPRHESGSWLNSYSMGDIVCWESREDAEQAAKEYVEHSQGLYLKCEVELVAQGQKAPSINEEREERRVARVRQETGREILSLLSDTSRNWYVTLDAREELREFLRVRGLA